MAVLNNLYPPIVPTYGEPFVISNGGVCIVPFTISKYNTIDEIETGCVQVTVFKQNTNLSALNSTLYPCGIMCTQTYTSKPGEYYIKIFSSDIGDSGFQINTYYRAQIRLTKSGTPTPQGAKISDWLRNNENNFSEWSTVCLVRGTLQPELQINNMGESEEDSPVEWKSSNVDIVGKLSFSPSSEEETDYLKEYSIKMYDDLETLVFDSGTIYVDTYAGLNEINYTIKRIFKDGEQYRLDISYLTKVGWNKTQSYYLLMLDEGIERLNVIFNSEEDAEKGRIGLKISSVTSDIFNGDLVIRRSCGDTGFTIWEDVAIINVVNRILDITWYDYTVQSGQWYRYGIQTKNEDSRGILTIYNKELMIEFDTIFLNANGTQIQIKYNPQISSFQHTISENKTETIGGKYPFIKRNGNMDYKQFPISGLITSYMDSYASENQVIGSNNVTFNKNTEGENTNFKDSLFTSKEEMYGEEVLSLYDVRMDETNSDTLDTIIYEKDFRDKVKEFLYEHNVKLFRSATEGNILVKLMNISFSPNQSLGRRIWSFSATAYEVDECSIENFDKYNIQAIGSEVEHLEYIDNYLGQFNGVAPAETNLINLLEDEYQKYCKQNYIASIDKLTYLRLQFNDKPYLIDMGQHGSIPSIAGENPSENTIVGYLVTINGQIIVVNESGVYELKADEIEITDIVFPIASDVTLDYELVLSQTADTGKVIKSISYKKAVGQLRGTFTESDELIAELKRKYSVSNSEWYQELTAVNGMRIEADEGTIVYVKEKDESEYQKHIIGPTESLDFYDPESVIHGVYFYGMHLTEADEIDLRRATLPWNKFVNSGISAATVEEIQNPQRNNTYLIGGNRKIYYRDSWYDINNNNDIECPVVAMVDYYCEYARGTYARAS